MKKTKISDRLIHEDELVIGGKKRPIKFNIEALGYAEQFLKSKGITRPAEEILKRATKLSVDDLTAVVYGALKSANKKYNSIQFMKEFSVDQFPNYIKAATKGLNEFLPEATGDEGNALTPKK